MNKPLRVFMITSEWPTPDKPHQVPFIVRQVDFLRKAGVDVHLFSFRGGKNPLNYYRCWKEAQARLARGNYDLVHAQWGQSGLLAFPRQVPVVVTFRGDDLEGIVGPTGRHNLFGFLLRTLSGWVARKADQVIVVSQTLARRLPDRSYHVIPSGLDLELFRPVPQAEARRKLGLDPRKKYILFAGSTWNPRKRYPLARQAVELLKDEFDVELLVVTNITHDQIPDYMNASDALLLTSVHEGSPNVVKEALACNLAVVSTNVGDVAQRIGGIQGCKLLEDDRPETIAAALKEVLLSNERVDSRPSVLELDERILTQKVIGVYRQALSGLPGGNKHQRREIKMNKLETNKDPDSQTKQRTKVDDVLRRMMDIVLSLFGLIVLSPLFLLISIAIKRSSPGPVFYWGPRAGKDGRTFNILKFRTMYERKESYEGPKVTAENDPRVTPLGRILRQTKINELPQLWNVLKGEMSLVGPRPEDPAIAAGWPEQVRKEILSVKPGITSPASVVYRNEEDLLQSSNLMDTYLWDILPTKVRLDQLYVRNRTILSDLDVIFWTLVALIPRLRGFSVPEHLLYWGPFSRFMYRYFWWFVVDFVVSFFAVATAGIMRRLTTPLDLGLPIAVAIALSIALLFSAINALAGLNRINWSRASTQDAVDLAFSSAIVTALVLVANLVFPRGVRFPISVIIVSGILSYIGFLAVRYRTRLLTVLARRWLTMRGQSIPSSLGERVLIVGAGEVARFAIWLLSNENLAQAFSIVGMVDDDPRKVGSKINSYTVISTTSAIPELIKKYDIGLVLFAIADIQPAEQERILSLCRSTQARIIPIPDVLDSLRAQFPKDENEQAVHFNKVLHNATTDRLTGAYNKLHFTRLAEVEFNRAQRYGHPLSLVMLQVSYARPKKASYDSLVANRVLQMAARRCMENIRGIDILGRYADDVLLVLLPETNEEAAELVAQRLREKITAQPVETNQGQVQTLVDYRLVYNRSEEFKDAEEMLRQVFEPFSPALVSGEAIAYEKPAAK